MVRPAAAADHASLPAASSGAVSVEVASPRAGGLHRDVTQPGTVEPFESADLYAKVSGFLAEQSVDIGSVVKKGQVLARIAVPEYEKQVERDAARLRNAEAKVKQANARVTAARAEAKAAHSQVVLSETMARSKTAFRTFRQKEFNRLRRLNDQQAVDAQVVDEKQDQYEAAVSAEEGAKSAVTTSQLQAEAAEAKIVQAEADLDEARAEVGVASAELDKSKVWLAYAVITSPYDGVITNRNFFPGAFIRPADAGGHLPLLSVDRVDLMRVVVQVPDRDVPYTTVGDPASLEIDALPGRTFQGKVARYASAEDQATRTMRTEVDVPNPDGALRRGMYGRASIVLDVGTAGACCVPTAALTGRTADGKVIVRVVRGGVVHNIPARVGQDNGIDAEVIGELGPTDKVIVRASGPITEGSVVSATAAPHPSAGH